MTGPADVSDVIVIGGGIVGSAIARALAGTNLSVTLVEARDDVGDGTSKANTAMLHTGFDAKPDTLESRLVARGYELLGDYATQTGIPVEHTGALLVAWTDEELDALPGLQEKAEQNFYHRCEIVDADEVYRRVPDLGPGVLGGLTVPDESIICTWTTNLALATDAVARGATLMRGARVTGVVVGDRAHHAADHPRRRARSLGRQRGRPRRRLPRRGVRARPLHRHPAARRAARLRQADPADGAVHRARRCRRRAARACWSARPSTAT